MILVPQFMIFLLFLLLLKVYVNMCIILFICTAQTSGTTVTFVIIEGWVVTVASVGDSRCILEPSEGGLHYLSADHRLDTNEEE